MGVTGDDDVDRGVLDSVGDVDDRALPRHRGVAVDGVAAQRGALVDQHHLDPDSLPSKFLRLRPNGLGLVGGTPTFGCARADKLGCLLSPMPISPIWIPWWSNTCGALHPVGVLPASPRRRCWHRGTGSWPVPAVLEPRDAVVEFVVAVRGRVETPRVLDIDRRHVLQQTGVRRRGADVVAAGQQRVPRGTAPLPRSNIVANCDAPPTVMARPSIVNVVCSSCPWKS